MSQLMGADVTFGAADGICQSKFVQRGMACRAKSVHNIWFSSLTSLSCMYHPRDTVMGIVADEIIPAGDEGPSSSSLGGGGVGGICTDAPLTGLAAARRLERAQAAIAAASARLRSGPAFARAVRSFPAGMAVHMGGIDGALPCYGSTEEWAALVKGGMELVADVVGRRTTHMLLFPRLLAPEDRPLCYRAVIRSVFSQEARRQTEFVKVSRCLYVVDGMAMHGFVCHLLPLTPALPRFALLLLAQVFSKSGAPRLYILTTEGTEAVAGGWGLIYALEPMPTSRCTGLGTPTRRRMHL